MYVSLLSICLGILIGFLGRWAVFAQYPHHADMWWVAVPLLVLCCGLAIKHFRRIRGNRRTAGPDSRQRERSAEGVERYQQWTEPEDFATREAVMGDEKIQPATHLTYSSTERGDNGRSSPDHALKEAGLEAKGRKVRVQRMRQRGSEKPSLPIIGVELGPPRKGMEYRVLTAQGIFKVPALTDVYLGYVKTKDSFFSIDVLEG